MQATLDSTIEIKSINDETGEFEGYASTYGNVDKGNDICVKGCFDETLTAGQLPAMCWQHDMKEVIGEWLEMKSDAKGLYVKGRIWINKGIARAEQAFQMLKSRGPKGLSIGFIAKAAAKAKNGVRMITKALLKEISVVTYPMNDQAQVLSVKSEGGWEELEEKMNPNHDEHGRFSSSDGGGSSHPDGGSGENSANWGKGNTARERAQGAAKVASRNSAHAAKLAAEHGRNTALHEATGRTADSIHTASMLAEMSTMHADMRQASEDHQVAAENHQEAFRQHSRAATASSDPHQRDLFAQAAQAHLEAATFHGLAAKTTKKSDNPNLEIKSLIQRNITATNAALVEHAIRRNIQLLNSR